jgi:hypothetical protein
MDVIACEHHEKASNDQCRSAHPGSNGQTDFYMRRVYEMATWIGAWIWLMVTVTAELESQGSGP